MIHEFDTSIYPCKIWITYDATIEELNTEFPLGDSEGKIFKRLLCYNSYAITDAVYNTNEKYGVLIRFDSKDNMNIPNITHECVHAAQLIFTYIGADSNDNSGEPFAYLASYIAKCCNIACNQLISK